MTEKKPEDLPTGSPTPNKPTMTKDKPNTSTVELPAPTHVTTVPVFSKTPPNDLYKRLLPAVLFLLTFVTVMTVLLIYMDTVALGAQQFRLNMTKDHELRIPQDSPKFVAYVRQLHLTDKPIEMQPVPTRRIDVIDTVFPKDYIGTVVEIFPWGGREAGAGFLVSARGWRGAGVRAAPRDYLEMGGVALHAGLATTVFPREVTYHAPNEEHSPATFSSRVLCLPLYTILLATDATEADYLVMGGPGVPKALQLLPRGKTNIKLIEYRSLDAQALNATTVELKSRNYTIYHTFEDGIMYKLNNYTYTPPQE